MLSLKSSKLNFICISFSIITLIALAGYSKNKISLPNIRISVEEDNYTMNSNIIKLLSIGNMKAVSSIIWSYTLLNADTEHTKNKSNSSWLYKRFDSITLLDPMFYENYLYGGKYLSILKDDIHSAQNIYDRGLVKFPNDIDLLWNAAFNSYHEIKDIEKSLTYYERIEQFRKSTSYPATPIIIARIKEKRGLNTIALSILLSSYETSGDLLKPVLFRKIYELKAKIDLECLNYDGVDCSIRDFKGKRYLRSNAGQYYLNNEEP